ncbi:protein tyrosine phosphatase [Jiella endophytica]|uniref:Protein tyrosine phosphatase n=2 Tax=Jiella endophytica TaxID=2558362 RepID=A0A4Y8RB03_9HYPH|nr:protein tyrosine phosphatase [Jiella endophytica]
MHGAVVPGITSPDTPMHIPKFLRNALFAAGLLITPAGAYAGYLAYTGNIHAVEPGVVYRSGQLAPGQLRQLIEANGIRSILNLRGAHPDEEWYRGEEAVAAEHGVISTSIGISANREPSMAKMREIEAAIRDAPKPLLIHCKGGADRSGLASAIYEYALAGRPAEAASGQLSFAYGHFPWLTSRTGAMDRAFARFVDQENASRESLESVAGENGRQ